MSTALITGASAGLGATFAQELAKRQTDLVLVARSHNKLQQLAQDLQATHGIQVEVIAQDLTAPDAAPKVFETVNQNNITIDLLVNNAGFGDYSAFSQTSRHKQLEMIQLNILALVDLTHHFLPPMQQRGSGSIINVSSIAGFQPLPYLSIYAATKAFILSFSEALWAENQHTGVKVIAACPGPTETNFFTTANFEHYAPDSLKQQQTDSPEMVVQEIIKALDSNDCTVVTGRWQNHLIVNLPRFLPRKTLVQIVEKQFRPQK